MVSNMKVKSFEGVLRLQSSCRCTLQTNQPCCRQVKPKVSTKPVPVLIKPNQPTFREAENDGWCQYQAVIQTFLGPLFAVFASAVALDTIGGSLQVFTIALNLSRISISDILPRCGSSLSMFLSCWLSSLLSPPDPPLPPTTLPSHLPASSSPSSGSTPSPTSSSASSRPLESCLAWPMPSLASQYWPGATP